MSRCYRPNKKGRTYMWCAVCQDWFVYDERWDGLCPRCHLIVERMKCYRCGHEWTPNRGRIPERCPRCNNPYWNRERMRDPQTLQWYEGYGPAANPEKHTRKAVERNRRRKEKEMKEMKEVKE